MIGHHPAISRCDEMEYIAPVLMDQKLLRHPDKTANYLSLQRQYRGSGFSFDSSRPVKESLRAFREDGVEPDKEAAPESG